MKCPNCGYWNTVPVNKVFIEQNTPEPNVKALIRMYEPLEICHRLSLTLHPHFDFQIKSLTLT